ncbi:OVCH1 protein, partial [Corythaixoides concolor]|nr:OVCH1 protein [Corythaixoides concolor]
QVRQVKTIVVHPHFDMLSYDSDIDLMQLDIPLEYNTAVRPVCLTAQRDYPPLCHMSGWGIMEEDGSRVRWLQQTHKCLYLRIVCVRNYYFSHPGGITARMLCAGFVSVGGQDF